MMMIIVYGPDKAALQALSEGYQMASGNELRIRMGGANATSCWLEIHDPGRRGPDQRYQMTVAGVAEPLNPPRRVT